MVDRPGVGGAGKISEGGRLDAGGAVLTNSCDGLSVLAEYTFSGRTLP